MSTIAVVIALGGTAYAATQITGRQIKNGTITGKDVKAHSLGATRLAAGLFGGTASYDGSGQATVGVEYCPTGAPCPEPEAQQVFTLPVELPRAANLAFLTTVEAENTQDYAITAGTTLDNTDPFAFNGEASEDLPAGAHTFAYHDLAHDVPAGHHTLTLKVLATGASSFNESVVVRASIVVIATPPSSR